MITVEPQIRVRCTECSYSRSFGQAMVTAETKASAHGIRRNHTVGLWKGNELLRLIHEHDNQNDLLDVPPF